GVAHPAAYVDVLHGAEESICAGHCREFTAKSGDYFIGAGLAHVQVFEGDEHSRGIRSRARSPGKGTDGVDGGIGHYYSYDIDQLVAHRLKRDILCRLDVALEPACILLGKEAFWHDNIEIDVEANREDRHSKHEQGMAQNPGEASAVAAMN